MSVLSDRHIVERISLPEGDPRRLVINPYSPAVNTEGEVSYGLSSGGYDLRVGCRFLLAINPFTNAIGAVWGEHVISPKRCNSAIFEERICSPGEPVRMPPHGFMLAEAMEWLEIPEDVIGVILGKSSYARSGVCVNMTPAEPGWRGRLTIEIANLTPLPCEVYAGEGIAQILFHQLSSLATMPYNRKARQKYQDQPGVTLPIC